MILNRLWLTNFGPFRGEHEFVLSPDNGTGEVPRTVILFGGKNGSGKTSILRAIRLCLFGPLALGSRVSEADYAAHLAEAAHRPGNGEPITDPTAVELEFDYVIMGKVERFRVRREWDALSGSRGEYVSVVRNGEHLGDRSPDQWQQFVKHLMPPGLADLFFFDGEAIQTLADDDLASGRLADSIASLLGLDLVDRLVDDLGAYERYRLTEDLDKEQQQEVRVLQRRLGTLDERRTALLQNRAQAEAKLARLDSQIESGHEQLAREGGLLPEEIKELRASRQELRDHTARLAGAARSLCSAELPVALCKRLAERLAQQLAVERAHTVERHGQEMLKSLLSELGTELLVRGVKGSTAGEGDSEKSRLATALRESVDAVLSKRGNAGDPQVVHDMSESQTDEAQECIGQRLPEAAENGRTILQDLREKSTALEDLERRLSQLPEDAHLAHLVEPLKSLHDSRGQLVDDIATIERDIKAQEAEIAEAEREIKKTHSDDKKAKEAQRKRDLVGGLRQALGHYRDTLVGERVPKLSEAVSENFSILSRKGSTDAAVRLRDGRLEIVISDSRGRRIPHRSLSAGERQLLAIAFLWGLAKVSGRHLPIIVDTPLARLDSDHRDNVIREYFPRASHQMILLSTDTEVDLKLFRQLSPRIARAHKLEFDEEEAATRVTTGYFW